MLKQKLFEIGAWCSCHPGMVVRREPELCKVRPEWLKEPCALNVAQCKLKVLGKERDASFAREVLAQGSELITLDVALKQRQFLLQDLILILLVRMSRDIVKTIARCRSRGVHEG